MMALTLRPAVAPFNLPSYAVAITHVVCFRNILAFALRVHSRIDRSARLRCRVSDIKGVRISGAHSAKRERPLLYRDSHRPHVHLAVVPSRV